MKFKLGTPEGYVRIEADNLEELQLQVAAECGRLGVFDASALGLIGKREEAEEAEENQGTADPYYEGK